ncbi:MAG: lysophospholipid acyltransferase family protein [Fuerstiella sp.]|nr:lysophospholipid acyltransferase family protein [Fuerstiella sp.]
MKIRNRTVHKIIAWSAVLLLRILFLTVRTDIRVAQKGAMTNAPPVGSVRYCFCLWHDIILAALFCHKAHSLSTLISRHEDGTYLSDLIGILGIRPIRGSTSRGGAQATKQLLEIPDQHICITPDGPRGPRHKMKDGITFIAARTGRPIVAVTVKATRCWKIPGRWSDIMIPKPFSKLVAITGVPIMVSSDLSREQIADTTARVQDEMDRLDALSDRLVMGDESVADLIVPRHQHMEKRVA